MVLTVTNHSCLDSVWTQKATVYWSVEITWQSYTWVYFWKCSMLVGSLSLHIYVFYQIVEVCFKAEKLHLGFYPYLLSIVIDTWYIIRQSPIVAAGLLMYAYGRQNKAMTFHGGNNTTIFWILKTEKCYIHLQTVVCHTFSRYRKQGNKLRRLMTFAWPCLLMKNCIDPATKYHGCCCRILLPSLPSRGIMLQVGT